VQQIISFSEQIMDRITAARVFITIAERASLTSAAEALDMSRAMVTRHLAEMESWAGTRLFHRSTRRISLTAAGEEILERCRDMLTLAEQMPIVGEELDGKLRGVLRVACAPSLAKATLIRAVSAFLETHPQTAINLQVSYKTVNLVEERVDLAIRVTNNLDPGLIARRLADCPLVVCAAPAYLQRHGAPEKAEDLVRHNCLTFAFFGKSLWSFQRNGENVNVSVRGNFSANDSLSLLDAAINGAGITQQPLIVAAPYIASGELVRLLPDMQPATLGIYGVYTSREYQPALLRAMLDFLAEWFAAAKSPDSADFHG
jgi:DNA-binding transcriptional LysR family regulator